MDGEPGIQRKSDYKVILGSSTVQRVGAVTRVAFRGQLYFSLSYSVSLNSISYIYFIVDWPLVPEADFYLLYAYCINTGKANSEKQLNIDLTCFYEKGNSKAVRVWKGSLV